MRLGGSLSSHGLDNMPKPLLNGNSTGVVGASGEDAATMVAAYQDRLASCVKLQDGNYGNIEIKEERFPCDFDHMYASMTEHDSAAVAAEVRHLKDLLLLHLDLIQQQSEQIVNKDKQLQNLRQENEMLRQRLERMDRRVTLHHNKRQSAEPPSSCSPPHTEEATTSSSNDQPAAEEDSGGTVPMQPFPKVEGSPSPRGSPLTVGPNNKQTVVESNSAATNNNNTSSSNNSRPSRSRKSSWSSDTGTANSRRSACSTSAGESRSRATSPATTTAATTSASTTVTYSKRTRMSQSRRQTTESNVGSSQASEPEVKRSKIIPPTTSSKTPVLYYCPANVSDEDKIDPKQPCQQALLEVPRWRIKTYTSCYSMEGTENLEDEVFLKRHQRLELDERRRKRWDIQRMREQRQYEKLKQRQQQQAGQSSRKGTATRKREHQEEVPQLWPDPENVQFIEVDEFLPVTAFGVPVPAFMPSIFELPWGLERESRHSPSNHEQKIHIKQEKRNNDSDSPTPAPPPPSPELPPPPPPPQVSSRTRRRSKGNFERRRTSARRR